MSSPAARTLPLPTGVQMEVLDAPSPPVSGGSRPVLIFVHGAFHAAWAFRFFQPWFAARGFQTHAVSLRGRGGSTHPTQTTPVTLQEDLADLTAVLHALSPDAAPVLFGHSLGGYCCQKLLETMDAPRRIGALVLLAGAPPRHKLPRDDAASVRGPERVVGMETRRRALFERGVARDLELCRLMYFSPKDAPGFDEAVEGDATLRGYMPLLDSDSLRLDPVSLGAAVAPRADGFSPPVLAVAGSFDIMQDRARTEIVARMWGGDELWVEHAPHNLMLCSGWREVASKIATWLSTKDFRATIPE